MQKTGFKESLVQRETTNKIETLQKLLSNIKADDSIIYFLTAPDFHSFFRQLHHPNQKIRQLSFQLILYLLLSDYKHEVKQLVLQSLMIQPGLVIFNSFQKQKGVLETEEQIFNKIEQTYSEYENLKGNTSTTLGSPPSLTQVPEQLDEQEYHVLSDLIVQTPLKSMISDLKPFDKCYLYCYQTGNIINLGSNKEIIDPIEYLVFGIVQNPQKSTIESQPKYQKRDIPKIPQIKITQSFNGNDSINFSSRLINSLKKERKKGRSLSDLISNTKFVDSFTLNRKFND